jgi:hypothetical protein
MASARAFANIPMKFLAENKIFIVGCNIHVLITCQNCTHSYKCMSRLIKFPVHSVGQIKKLNENTIQIEEKPNVFHRVYFADSKQLDRTLMTIIQQIDDFPQCQNQVLA